MDKPAEQLVVRQHERHTCRLPADVSLTADSPCRVALSRSVGNGTGVLGATVVDCSAGGLGLESPVFLPRHSRVALRLDLGPDEPAIEIEGTVQRATMVSREPKYYLGIAFRGPGAPSPAVVDRLLGAIADRALAPSPGGRPA